MKDFHQSSKQFKSDLTALEQVLVWFDQLHQPSIPRKVWLQCQLALAEGFTNAVRHAHKGLPTDVSIELEVTLFRDHLEMRVWDHGPPFDLEDWFKKHDDQVNASSGGGRGIAILQKIADQLSYRRTEDNRNCLLLVKQF